MMQPDAPSILREIHEGRFHAQQIARYGTRNHARATKILYILMLGDLVELVGDEYILTPEGLDQIQEAQW